MNVVLLSPNFPPSYYQFAVALRRAGANAFGIGDVPDAWSLSVPSESGRWL